MCTVYFNANYATITFNTLNKISHQHVNDKKQIKLSKTEKMTCLIRPWKWNSINRSLKSKKNVDVKKKEPKVIKVFTTTEKHSHYYIYCMYKSLIHC